MQQSPFSNRRVMQNSWVVPDIHAAMQAWTRTTGVGPFFLVEGVEVQDQYYRGQPVDVKASFALAQAGPIQIELVSQLNRAPSAYRDTVPEGVTAFHHVALYCHDYDADLRDYTASGAPVAYSGSVGGKRFCYVDTTATIGCMVELIEASVMQDEFFERIRAAAMGWSGADPVRAAF